MATAPTVTSPDRISKIKAELAELNKKQSALKKELEKLEEIPKYIDNAVKMLIGHFGPDFFGDKGEFEKHIREALQEGLTSVPEEDTTTENVKRDIYITTDSISYTWKGKRITYEVVREDEYHSCAAQPAFTQYGCTDIECCDPSTLRDIIATIYHDYNCEDMLDLNPRYIPILIGYMNHSLEDIDYIK